MNISGLKYSPSALAEFAQKHNLMLVILYGSRAEETADDHSDWDIAVMPKHGIRFDKYKLLIEFDKLFPHEIDSCIITSDSDPLHRWEVFRVGIPLYEDRPDRFVEEFVLAWKIFLDTEKFRRLEREIIEEYK